MTKPNTDWIEDVHFMADIETLGTRHRPVIISIGLAAFSRASGILGRFYVGVDIASCMRHGAHIDPETLLWWLDPKRDAARAEWVGLPKLDIEDALDALVSWTSQWSAVVKRAPDEVPVETDTVFHIHSLWGKGATFDCVHLRDAALYCGVSWPFSFRQEECYRTIMNRNPNIPAPRVESAHSAIADAEAQALHLLQISQQTGMHL